MVTEIGKLQISRTILSAVYVVIPRPKYYQLWIVVAFRYFFCMCVGPIPRRNVNRIWTVEN